MIEAVSVGKAAELACSTNTTHDCKIFIMISEISISYHNVIPRFCSFAERSSDYPVLPVSRQRWRLDLDAMSRNDRPQQPIFSAPLHSQRDLRHKVTSPHFEKMLNCRLLHF